MGIGCLIKNRFFFNLVYVEIFDKKVWGIFWRLELRAHVCLSRGEICSNVLNSNSFWNRLLQFVLVVRKVKEKTKGFFFQNLCPFLRGSQQRIEIKAKQVILPQKWKISWRPCISTLCYFQFVYRNRPVENSQIKRAFTYLEKKDLEEKIGSLSIIVIHLFIIIIASFFLFV